MFTGIIDDIGTLSAVEGNASLKRVRIQTRFDSESIKIGASIACGGPCLTVVDKGFNGVHHWFDADVAAETLNLTTARHWQVGTRLNLERSLKVGDELGGHIVTGHIDGLARLIGRETVTDGSGGQSVRFVIEVPEVLKLFIAQKGSVALDGTSLTVNEIDDNRLSVLLIPHTLDVTTWGEREPGDDFNLEVDLMARYAARLAHGSHPLRT